MGCSKSSATVFQQLASLVFMQMCWLNLVFLLKQVDGRFLIAKLVKYNMEELLNCYEIKVQLKQWPCSKTFLLKGHSCDVWNMVGSLYLRVSTEEIVVFS